MGRNDTFGAVLIAHFSDIHITVPPTTWHMGEYSAKRLAGAFNYYFGGRKQQFAQAEAQTRALVADVLEQGVDHVLCTGDLTAVGVDTEFARVAAAFSPLGLQGVRFSLLPGNHDRYTQAASESFDRHFEERANPFVDRVGRDGEVIIVGLDVTRPTAVGDSSGFCGAEKLAALEATLSAPELRNKFVILAIHYGLLRSDGSRDRRGHGLVDDVEVLKAIDSENLELDLIVHGHMHRPFMVRTQRRLIHCTGSATDLSLRCGYNIYSIDPVGRAVSVRRRVWSEGRYEAG